MLTLRRNADATAEELRQSLPAMLAGVVAEVRGAELQLSMLADADGMVDVGVAASAGDDTPTVAAELAAILESVAETEIRSEHRGVGAASWPVVADCRPRRLGFSTDPNGLVRAVLTWHSEQDLPPTQLVEELAAMPGQGLRVRLCALPQAPQPMWEAQLSVITTGDEPSLRMRAAVRRRYPGLQVAASAAEEQGWLQLTAAALPHVFALPVAGSEPPAGTYAGPRAPITVAPDRGHSAAAEGDLRIGYALTAGGRALPVNLTLGERLRHIHVLGQTGTGKSSALAGMVRELAAGGDGALIADPHGQLCDRVLAELPDEARERVWVIRCGDVDNPVPINPLAEIDPVRRDIAIADLCATFEYLFDTNQTGIVGPRFHERVAMTLRALAAAHGTRASLLDVPVASADDEFMETAVSLSEDDRLKIWWRTNKLESRSTDHGQVIAWVNSKFASFSETAAMRAILGSGADAIDFAQAMDDGRIILLDLSKAELGEPASRLLGFMYLNRVWQAALRRQRPDRPFTVIVDEAHALIAGALTNMLAEGRKFGLSVTLAHQYLAQLAADLRPAVNGNVATTIAFRCAVGDALELYKRFGGMVDTSVLVTLPELNAISLRTAAPSAAHPYTLIIDHNDRITARQGDELASHVRAATATTYAALVDPHRNVTAAASGGASNVTTISIDAPPAQSPRVPPIPRRPTVKRSTAGKVSASASKRSDSFLDQWLAQRAGTENTDTADNDGAEQTAEPAHSVL